MKKRIFVFILSVIILLASFNPVKTVNAASPIIYSKNVTIYYDKNQLINHYTFIIDGLEVDQNVSNITSTNKSILRFKEFDTGYDKVEDVLLEDETPDDSSYKCTNIIVFDVKKTGKCAILFKYKNKTYKCSVTVKKFSNSLSSVKIKGAKSTVNLIPVMSKGFRENIKTLNVSDWSNVNIKSKNARLEIKPLKGWHVTQIKINNCNYEYNNPDKQTKTVNVELGDTKDLQGVIVIETADKNGNIASYGIHVNEPPKN